MSLTPLWVLSLQIPRSPCCIYVFTPPAIKSFIYRDFIWTQTIPAFRRLSSKALGMRVYLEVIISRQPWSVLELVIAVIFLRNSPSFWMLINGHFHAEYIILNWISVTLPVAACQPDNVRPCEMNLSESVWKHVAFGFSNRRGWVQKIFCDIYFCSMNEQNIQESADGSLILKVQLRK